MVRAKTLQVVWHSKEPVYSVDFHPNGQLITGGADNEVKVWEVDRGEDGYATVKHVSSLAAHLNTVNCVRFSPTGKQLATSGDGGEVLLWEPVDPAAAASRRGNLCEDDGDASWRRCAAFKGHAAGSDVMDLCWAPDGSALVTGAIDSEVFLWGTEGKRRGEHAGRLKNHKHFVQGVTWDPAQQYVVTQSADRTCRVYALKPPAAGRKNKVSQYLLPAGDTARDMYCAHTLSKRALPAGAAAAESGAAGGAKAAMHPLFADERVNTFFRRPAWSPDGSLLVLPAGVYKATAEGRELNTAYVYARGKWSSPVMHLPGHSKPIVVVRFCPVLFERDDAKPAPQQPEQQQEAAGAAAGEAAGGSSEAPAPHPFDLPYKMVFAVATLDSVVLYDTQSTLPLAVLGQLHYDAITDLAWSSDAQFLAISSRDCYCSIATFDAGELGTPLPADKLPAHIAKRMAAAQRRAEPLKPAAAAAAATPAAVRAPMPQAAGGTAAAKGAVAGTPSSALGTSAKRAGAQADAVGAGHSQPAAAAALVAPAPVCGKKRIQPEPISAPTPGGSSAAAFAAAASRSAPAAGGAAAAAHAAVPAVAAQQGQAPAAKKPKRIVPEAVGPAPAVVGDSQQGGAEPRRFPEPPAPAGAKQPRRITPEAMGCTTGATEAGAGASSAPSGGGSATGAAVAGVVAKPVRRIVAEPVGPPLSAVKASLPAESGNASGKKRITPTPLRVAAEAVSQQFGGSAHQQQSAQPAPSELSRDGVPTSARRITPIPVGRVQALPQGEERTATAVPRGGIAALAAAMGAQAAHARPE